MGARGAGVHNGGVGVGRRSEGCGGGGSISEASLSVGPAAPAPTSRTVCGGCRVRPSGEYRGRTVHWYQ
jgi:hypothetical protein